MPSENVLIVGGGPAGLEATRLLADIGTKVVLVEKREFLGGTPIAERYAALTHGFHDAEEMMNKMIAAVTDNPLVDVRLNSTVTAVEGEAGNFKVTLAKGGNGHRADCFRDAHRRADITSICHSQNHLSLRVVDTTNPAPLGMVKTNHCNQ